jgi:hypothetical protein
MMNDELSKVPIVDIKRLIEIRKQKFDVVQRQAYEEAAKLRDEERTIEEKYSGLYSINTNDLVNILREKKIDRLLDDSGI